MSQARICAVAVLLVAGPALADGLQPAVLDATVVQPVAVAPSSAAAGDWSGFYAGGFAGLAYSLTDNTDYAEFLSLDAPDSEGVFGQIGLTAGYNWQRGSLVYGVEADVSTGGEAEQIANDGSSDGGTSFLFASEANYIATIRGRAGLAVDDTVLFLSAGVSLSDLEHRSLGSNETDGPFAIVTVDAPNLGLALGGGVEHRITDALSLKADYLVTGSGQTFGCIRESFDAGCRNPGNETIGVYFRNTTHAIRVGVNYHF
jgi:outer membrane immunogenic protein